MTNENYNSEELEDISFEFIDVYHITEDEYRKIKSIRDKYKTWILSAKTKIERYEEKIDKTQLEIEEYKEKLEKYHAMTLLYEMVNRKES